MIYRRAKGSNATLTGKESQFSGNPFTLVENTNCNMALTNVIYHFVDLVYAIYKGDDMDSLCTRAVPTDEGREFLKLSQHKLKFHLSDVGEFASFIINGDSVGPDLYRRTCKFVGQMYRDKEHFDEAKVAVTSSVSTIVSERQLRSVCLATSYHYGSNIVTPEQCFQLYGFLAKSAVEMDFDSLARVSNHTRQPEN
jgi:hypothetical protein